MYTQRCKIKQIFSLWYTVYTLNWLYRIYRPSLNYDHLLRSYCNWQYVLKKVQCRRKIISNEKLCMRFIRVAVSVEDKIFSKTIKNYLCVILTRHYSSLLVFKENHTRNTLQLLTNCEYLWRSDVSQHHIRHVYHAHKCFKQFISLYLRAITVLFKI